MADARAPKRRRPVTVDTWTRTWYQQIADTTSQDGPGWWAARTAIERAKQQAIRSRGSYVRTLFATQPPTEDPWAGAIDAFLLMRDATVDRMAPRQRRLLLGLLDNRTQADLAEQEGITQSAVSQALGRAGALAIMDAQERLREEVPW